MLSYYQVLGISRNTSLQEIKKSYKKDGKLSDDEKSIAYATAWKNYNKEEVINESVQNKKKYKNN